MCTPELSKAEDGKISFNNLSFPKCIAQSSMDFDTILATWSILLYY